MGATVARRLGCRATLGHMARKYATADRVGETELLDFIRPRHHMVLTTFRADGSPQTSPVTGGFPPPAG